MRRKRGIGIKEKGYDKIILPHPIEGYIQEPCKTERVEPQKSPKLSHARKRKKNFRKR